VACREPRVGIPDLSRHDVAAERLRDVERVGELSLWNARSRTCSDVLDDIPGQLRVGTRKLVQPRACVEQLLFLPFGDAPVATPFVFRVDSESAPVKRRCAEQLSADCPVAHVTKSRQVAIGCRECPTGTARLEVLDRIRAFEGFRRQLPELRYQDAN